MNSLFPIGGAPNLTQIFDALQQIYQAIYGLQKTIATIFPNGLTSSATYDPPNIVIGTQATTTVTCVGAVFGMAVEASYNLDLQGIMLTAYVSAADTVTCVFANLTGGDIDLASGTLKVWVHN